MQPQLAEGVEDPGHGRGGHRGVWAALDAPDPALVGDVAGQGEEGGAGVPVAPLADSLLAAEAARRTVAPAGEGSQQGAEVARHPVVADQDLLHGLGHGDTGEHLGEGGGGGSLGLHL